MEVFTSNMTIAVIMIHSECREVPNSRRNRERSHLLRGRIYLAIWWGDITCIYCGFQFFRCPNEPQRHIFPSATIEFCLSYQTWVVICQRTKRRVRMNNCCFPSKLYQPNMDISTPVLVWRVWLWVWWLQLLLFVHNCFHQHPTVLSWNPEHQSWKIMLLMISVLIHHVPPLLFPHLPKNPVLFVPFLTNMDWIPNPWVPRIKCWRQSWQKQTNILLHPEPNLRKKESKEILVIGSLHHNTRVLHAKARSIPSWLSRELLASPSVW